MAIDAVRRALRRPLCDTPPMEKGNRERDVQPSIVESTRFGCHRRAMGLLVEKDRKPSLYNKPRRGRAAGGHQKIRKVECRIQRLGSGGDLSFSRSFRTGG